MMALLLITSYFVVSDAWQINMVGVDGTTTEYEVDDYVKVDELKETVCWDNEYSDECDAADYPDCLKFLYDGQEMRGGFRRLGDYGLGNGATIHYDDVCNGNVQPMMPRHIAPTATVSSTTSNALLAMGCLISLMLACIAGLLCFAVCIRPMMTVYGKPGSYGKVNVALDDEEI